MLDKRSMHTVLLILLAFGLTAIVIQAAPARQSNLTSPLATPGQFSSPLPPPESVKFEEALLEDANTYASIHNVSVDEAMKRLTLQDIAENINAILVTREGTTFAGLWLQHEPDYRVIVRFTNNGDVNIKSYIKNTPLLSLVEVRAADVSLEELKLE